MTIDWQVHTYASLPSTQDYVKELAAEGLPEGTVIQCIEQRSGRGRHGRHWFSPMGNLYMSILLRPDCLAAKAGEISFVAAVALSSAIDEVLADGHKKSLKWPNDILIDGKKCAGILIESDLKGDKAESLVLGMGVNILNPPDEGIGLKEVAGDTHVAIHPFRDIVLRHFNEKYGQWQNQGFGPIRKQWMNEAHGLGEMIKVNIPGKETSGKFNGIDDKGTLLLEQKDGKVIAISSGDVYFGEE